MENGKGFCIVDLSSDINGEIEFLVPQGAKVKLDGNELDRKKYSEEYKELNILFEWEK